MSDEKIMGQDEQNTEILTTENEQVTDTADAAAQEAEAVENVETVEETAAQNIEAVEETVTQNIEVVEETVAQDIEAVEETATQNIEVVEETATQYGDTVMVILNGQKEEMELLTVQEGFDTNTGEPIMVNKVRVGFDGMSGEPLYAEVEKMGFDSDTGKPLYGKKESYSIPAAPAIVEGAKEKVSKGKGKKIIPIVAICVAVVAVLACVCTIFLNANPKAKIAAAVVKTLKEDTFADPIISAYKVLNSDVTTVSLKGNVKTRVYTGYYDSNVISIDVDSTVTENTNDATIGGVTKLDISGITEQSLEYYYDKEKIQFKLPEASKSLYEYNYKAKNNDGAIEEFLEEMGYSVDELNSQLSAISESGQKRKEYQKELAKVISGTKLNIKKISKKEFEIDDKERKCVGYRVSIDEKSYEDLVNKSLDTMEKVYGEILADIDMEEQLEDLRDEILDLYDSANLEDAYLDIYIWKGKLAAIEYEEGKEEFSLLFKGGSNRTSNMELKIQDKYSKYKLTRESSVEGGVEKGKIKDNEGLSVKYSFDKKTGELACKDIEPWKIRIKDGITVEYKGEIDYDTNVSLVLSITEGGKIKKLSGDVFNLGRADEDELMEEVMDIIDELELDELGLDFFQDIDS